MFRHGEISTETDKKPFVFTLIAFAASAAATVLLLVLFWGNALAIFAAVLLGIVAVSAGSVLFALLTDRAYIEGDRLHMSYMFRRREISLDKIGKISYKEDVYHVFGKDGNLVGTINGKLTGIGNVIFELDRRQIPFV